MGMLKYRSNNDAFELPSEGTVDLQIIEVKDDGTSKKGDPQVQCKLEICDGPEAGKKFTQWFTLNDKQGWLFTKLLEACGVDFVSHEDPNGGDPEVEVDTDELLMAYFRATIVHNESGGKTYANLTDLQPSEMSNAEGASEGGSGADDAPPEEVEDAPPEEAAPAPAPAAAPATRRRRMGAQ